MNEMGDVIDKVALVEIEIWDNSKRAKILLTIFWVLIVLTLIGVVSGYFELNLLNKFQQDIYVDNSEINANDLRQQIIGIGQTVIYIASVVVFLNWFRRSYGNLHRLGISLNNKESMTVWSWFIPIISLFKPVQIMSELWKETQNKIKKFDTNYTIKNGGLLIGLWWTMFIISNIIGRYFFKTVFKDQTLEELIDGARLIIVSDVMQVLEALLVILIVSKLSKMESKLATEVENSGGYVVYK